jgi:general secretion pathway protein D
MVNRTSRTHRALALALAMALSLAAPLPAFANDGKKHFKEGMKYEENRQWDKAAERFALAVADKPSNTEYLLHLQRALVNAGLMLVERGDMLAEKKDYNAAYQAYRQAYSFDPTNELARIKMRRMLEIQGLPTEGLPGGDSSGGSSYKSTSQTVKTTFTPASIPATPGGSVRVQMPWVPSRRYPRTDVIAHSDSLLSIIEQLAQDLQLNVLFDQQVVNQMRATRVNVDLRGVTKPKALEMILQTNNLMYTQLDTRTVVVAIESPQSRIRYEPYAVRTFYVKNADITEIRTAITSTLNSKQVIPIKQLNALIVRDTPSNLELIDNMINSLDKSKAEVLIDVQIYEVSRTDLLQIGNQFNPTGTLQKGLLNPGASNIGGIGTDIIGGTRMLTGPFGIGLGLPTSALSFFQNKGKAKLLASTQIHVLDDQQNTVRIGQRVPIQTASLPSFTSPNQTNNKGNNAAGQDQFLGAAFGVGIPQIQYENVGLNIDITPNVYEDEIQMKMKIEATSIDASTGKLTPSFNQRTMSSVARIKDGQTTLVAGVSQNNETKSVKGLPLIGLIPILGRFFATPETDNKQSDVVITVTPHILRRADIREEDHLARGAGTSADPGTQLTLEQILFMADQADAKESQVAAVEGQQPAAKPAPDKSFVNTVEQQPRTPGVVVMQPPTTTAPPPGTVTTQPPPKIEHKTVSAPGAPDEDLDDDDDDESDNSASTANTPVSVSIRSAMAVGTKGQDLYTVVLANGTAQISGAHVALSFDSNILEVKGVRDGGLLRNGGVNPELQFTADNGLLNVQLDRPVGSPGVPARGQLLIIIFTVKGQGTSPLTLLDGQTYFRSPTGMPVLLKLQSAQIEAR